MPAIVWPTNSHGSKPREWTVYENLKKIESPDAERVGKEAARPQATYVRLWEGGKQCPKRRSDTEIRLRQG